MCVSMYLCISICIYAYQYDVMWRARGKDSPIALLGYIREVGGWGRDPKKCTGRDWGMGSSTIA